MTEGDQLLRDLGRRVRTLREYRGMVQRELGDAIGLGRPSISNLEAGRQGNIPATSLVALAKALGVSVGVLLGEVEMPSLPVVEVVSLHRIHCSHCGRIDDNITDPGRADSIRRNHLSSHNQGATS